MGVDADRQATFRDRKRNIVQAFNAHMSLTPGSAVSRFGAALREDRTMIAGSDIDGIVSAMMLASVSTWRIGALAMKSEAILVSPHRGTPAELLADTTRPPFGIDVFSRLMPTASNHPVLFGTTSRTSPGWRRDLLADFDQRIAADAEAQGALNPSLWTGIKATLGSQSHDGIPYKYPLGTAQLLLAVLEIAGAPPRFYDRQYLPWLVANCDGGIQTIRQYPWNVEVWWSALAAVAGPASQSEALYRLVTDQRPTEFIDVDRRLRYDEPGRSQWLNTKWNLKSQSPEAITQVVQLISDLSGWPDPFEGGVELLGKWISHHPSRNVLPLTGMTALGEDRVRAHLDTALEGLHVNFSVFKERGTALGWMTADARPEIDQLLGEAPPEVDDDPEDSEPDLIE